jgi:hypothetical protein
MDQYMNTNFFRVTDEQAYAELISHLYGVEACDPCRYEKPGANGETLHTFTSCCGLEYYPTVDDADKLDEAHPADWDAFTTELGKLLPEGEAAIIITTAGPSAHAEIITRTGKRYIDLDLIATDAASQMLGDPNWKTDF